MKALGWLCILMVVSGCSVGLSLGDAMVQAGNARGIKAQADRENGMIAQAKASSDAPDTPYWQHRRLETRKKGWLATWLTRGEKNGQR